MALIKILPEKLVNQIAAGEVVERPSSVVKELVENCIDAGADKIVVELKNGGKTFVKVTDNGNGMSGDDVEMAISRHATSKILSESDLWKIKTMGFRGEALASISSVSKMTIKSKLKKDDAGTLIDVEGGEILTIKDVGMDSGTVIEVYNLFFNTPARQKYLKKDSIELSHITSTINNTALANPDIAFKLIHNGKVVSDLPKVTDLISRISDIFGKATAEAMIPVYYGGGNLSIDGFVGKPVLSRSTSKHQYLFVNGRPIVHYLIAHTVKSAFHSMLMENKKPVFVINLKIDPGLIDVNVHPRKVEIRFEDQQTILKAVYNSVKAALDKGILTPKAFTESRRYMGEGIKHSSPKKENRFSVPSPQDALEFSKNVMLNRESANLDESNSMSAITQISDCYIVAENEEGLILIDQHAAHERVRYEQLMDQFENRKKSVQPLLVPLEIEFSNDEIGIIEGNKEIFKKLGFEIKNNGKGLIVESVPAFLSGEDIDQVIKGVIDDILNEKSPTKLQGKTEQVINYLACRSAIKFGQSLSLEEMQGLIKQMDKCKRPYTCPHGRPTMVSLTLSELEKMFGRK
ncbi:DNA mismatch repair endonuclease MutL [Candidatus Peregrinibacteria bacterium]|nr:DNA mismatch repair endonuclease MutL [Candidatus Peregrinibacteria bacterium]